jgi:hypothetical protein
MGDARNTKKKNDGNCYLETHSAGKRWMEERNWGGTYSSWIVEPQEKKKKEEGNLWNGFSDILKNYCST